MRSLSPGQAALARLRRNRMAVAGAWVAATMAVLGFAAPLWARACIGFSPEEQHPAFAFAPPGTQDSSLDYRDYDGDSTAWPLVDWQRNGAIQCRLDPQPNLDTDEKALHLLQMALGPQAQWPEPSRVPLAETLAILAGQWRCPELETLQDAERFYAFLPDQFDRASGHTVPGTAVSEPDGLLSRQEFPNQLRQIADLRTREAARQLGLVGDAGWALLSKDPKALLTRQDIAASTLRTRLQPDQLLQHWDTNHDLAIDRLEFQGLPRMHRFWLGTDQKGRDLLVRLLYGARMSLTIGLLATLVSLLIGVSYGAIAGYASRRIDGLMMRTVDVLYGLPFLFLVIVLLVVAGRSTLNLFVALGAVSWLTMARIVRAQVLSLRHREFVEAARALGLSAPRILFRHILPNALGPIVVYATLSVPGVILEEAFLSFLGLGVQPPDASWGTLLAEGARLLQDQPWLLIWPAGALSITLFSLSFLGDGLRDALDPRAET